MEKVGTKDVLIFVGSSNSITKRTPYSFEDRAEIIRFSFPDVEVVPLPDGRANLEYFDGSTNDIWLDNIERIARKRDEKFVFYGGSKEDLEVLAERFETHVIVDRYGEGEGLSATQIRELIGHGKTKELEKLVEVSAIDTILEKYKVLWK